MVGYLLDRPPEGIQKRRKERQRDGRKEGRKEGKEGLGRKEEVQEQGILLFVSFYEFSKHYFPSLYLLKSNSS